ncbi:MAG: serine protease inhibitor [Geodermatophilaceae bacterium]|nr:serine protease inhibitor [Geodermatophilaceae bacterium]MDQ3465876.1 subtilase-type protease inhibitor [Actinomycetota bacterium]
MGHVTRTVLSAATFGVLVLAGCATPASDGGGGGGSSGGVGGGGSGSNGGGATGEAGPEDPASNDPGDPPATTTPPSPGTPLPAELTVAVDDGGGTITTYTLRCEPAGGDHPDPAAACDGLAAAAAAGVFGPPDPDQACTEIYGGPETATVTGTLDGAQVTSAFSRTNGCEIARWDALAAVLAAAGGAD